MTTTSNPEEEIAKKYLELAQSTEKIIQKSYEMVNDKIKTAFTLTSALITAISGLGYFIAKETQFYWILIPTFLSLMTFVLAVAIGIGLFRPTNFQYVDPMVIVNEYREKGYPLRFFLNKWASTISDTANGNADVVNSKEAGLNKMYSLIVIGLAIFAVSFVFLVICKM